MGYQQTDSTKPLLHLNLTANWFDMIAGGVKKEEYRAITDYWNRVFSTYIKIKGKFYHATDVNICFSNGYAKNRRQMIVECVYLRTRGGVKEWGAIEGEQYYTLGLGAILKKNF